MSECFNTAIFYDVENLLKGYNFSSEAVACLSLREILQCARKTQQVGAIAVQRAYANWSDPRLAIMRAEINDLGIEPVQVFGFGRETRKNAADIQLAIDAIDLAHVRPQLSVYVIVSGDGGFAALARKLHEYGKTVVGCSYRTAASRTFRALCDAFVEIDDPTPETEDQPAPRGFGGATGTVNSPLVISEVNDPRNARLAAQIRKASSQEPADILTKTREVLSWYANDPICRGDLQREGLYLSVVQEGVRFAVPGFQVTRLGFAKFIEYLQYACRDTPLCVVRATTAQTQAALALRVAVRNPATILPDLDPAELHSVEGYRAVAASGLPQLRCPPANAMAALTDWLAAHPPSKSDLNTILETALAEMDGQASPESIKHGLRGLVAAGAFTREPPNAPLAEQRLTLRGEAQNAGVLRQIFRAAVRQKLHTTLGDVRDDILDELLANPS